MQKKDKSVENQLILFFMKKNDKCAEKVTEFNIYTKKANACKQWLILIFMKNNE